MANRSTLKKVLISGALAFLAYTAYGTVQAFESMTFKIKNISFGSIVLGSPLPAVITFTLLNSTSYPVTINSIYGSILINGLTVATLLNSAITATTIPANGSVDIPVSITISISNAVEEIANSIISKTGMTTTFDGYITIQGVTLPIPINQSLTV